MLDESTMMEETTGMNSDEITEESGGAPVGFLIAGVLAGGLGLVKALSWIGDKINGRKKYAEVPPVRLVKDK